MEAGENAKLKREERARVKAEKKAQRGDGFGLDVDPLNKEGKSVDATTTELDELRSKQPSNGKEKNTSVKPNTNATSNLETNITKPTIPSTSTPTSPGHFHTIQSHPTYPSISTSQPILSLPHPLFQFPSTPTHLALLKTYTDLLNSGYRVGLGPRFGGEYLIYPGDYLRYHAHFTSQVIVNEQPVKPTELVAWGRLGTGTKKAGLLCCVDLGQDQDGEEGGQQLGGEVKKGGVEYYSLEWANFG